MRFDLSGELAGNEVEGVRTSQKKRSSSPYSTSSSSMTSSSTGATAISLRRNEIGYKKTLVITGGSGGLGSMIAKLAYNHWNDLKEIRLFDCRPPDQDIITNITGFSAPSGRPKVSYHHGDVLDEEALMTCFIKVDVVIHCAAIVERGSILSRRQMRGVNVDGTQNVIQACLDCGVQGLIFSGTLSQILGTDDFKKAVHYDESYQLLNKDELIFPHYGGSKNQAENLVLLANGQEGKQGIKLRTCSLRCPVMYGEGDREFVPTVIRASRCCCGYYIPLGLVGNSATTMQSLYIGNGAWSHILAAKKLLYVKENNCNGVDQGNKDSAMSLPTDANSDIGGKFYYIGDYSPVCSMSNFHAQFLRPLGYRVSPIGVPYFFLKIFAFFLEFALIVLATLHVNVQSPLNWSSLKYTRLSHSFSWDKAKKELNYSPLYSHKASLAQSMEFYRKTV